MPGKKRPANKPRPSQSARSDVRNVSREPTNGQEEGEAATRARAETEVAAACSPTSARIVSPDPNPMPAGPLDYLVHFNQTTSSDGAATVINQPQERRTSVAMPGGSPLVRTSGPAASLTPASEGHGHVTAPASTISGTSGPAPGTSGRYLDLSQDTIRDTTIAIDAIRRVAGRDIGGASAFTMEPEKLLGIDHRAGVNTEQHAVQVAAAAAIRQYAEGVEASLLAVTGGGRVRQSAAADSGGGRRKRLTGWRRAVRIPLRMGDE